MAAADASLAAVLGVAPSVIVAFRRELTLGVHWLQDAGGMVSYTDAGNARVREMAKVPPLPAAAESVVPKSLAFTVGTEEKKTGVDCLLVIVQCPANPRYVVVRTPESALAKVRVRSNEKLRPRHKLRCRLLADGRWECRQPGLAVPLPPLEKNGGPT